MLTTLCDKNLSTIMGEFQAVGVCRGRVLRLVIILNRREHGLIFHDRL